MSVVKHNCCICGVDDTRLVFQKDGFNIVKCKICGLIYVNPRLNESEQLDIYSDNYFIKNKDVGKFKRKTAEIDLNRLKKLGVKRGKVLDVGYGEGYFLEVSQKIGWEVYGVEIVKFDTNVAHFPDKYFDLITLFDVIEHFQNPLLELKEINRILKDDGFVYIHTPNIGGLFAKLMGKRWFQIKPEEHIFYFNKKTIKTILKKSGFEVLVYNAYGKVLTIEYVQQVLALTNTILPKVIKWLFSRLPFYRKLFYMKTGHLNVLSKKRLECKTKEN